jgi:predicted transglutaminase-like cysteine proteinase
MRSLDKLLPVAIAAMMAGSAAPADAVSTGHALETGSSHIGASVPTLAPLGYVRYCRANPDDCQGSDAVVLELDVDTFLLLDTVNASVNRAIEPVEEDIDEWVAYTAAGDCEDYALLKRALLIRAGVPAGALRMAVVDTEVGDSHAVLVVRTGAGDLVLDNLTDEIVVWNEARLAWRKIASEANPRLWFAIDLGM